MVACLTEAEFAVWRPVSFCDRVNRALDSLVLQVYQECLELKEYRDPREILVSLVVLDRQDDLDLMVLQELKVFCGYRCVRELVFVAHTHTHIHLHLLFTQNTPNPSDGTPS